VQARTDFTERWNLGVDAIEQTFVYGSLPERGELSVTMEVATELVAVEDGEALLFQRDGLGGVSYGAAFAVDADGRRTAVSRHFDGVELTLTVPAAFVESAALPLTIDPFVNSFTLSGSFPDDSSPAICFAKRPGQYFIVWEEFTSQTNADCYITSFQANGTQGPVIAVETGNDFWDSPSIGYVPAGDRLLIAASVTSDGPGTGLGRIEGRIFNAVTGTAATPSFLISTSGTQKVDPVVGGTNFESTTNNYFLVAWSRILSTTRHSIEYRAINWNSVPVTPVEILAVEEGIHNIQPAISASHGDSTLFGDVWTLAWIEKSAASFFPYGMLKAARITWAGAQFGNILDVSNSPWCFRPSVTSQFDDNFGLGANRPAVIAYEVVDPTASFRGDLFASVVNTNIVYPASPISLMENFVLDLDRDAPAIATDGRSFVLAYQEQSFNTVGPINEDVYMASGSLVRRGGEIYVALAERHQIVSASFSDDIGPKVVMAQDGNADLSLDDGMVVWNRDLGNPGGAIELALLDAATFQSAPVRAVGRQYCRANEHSGNADQVGPDTSWLWIEGDQNTQTVHLAHCVGMPPSAFGYLLCSRSSGSVNNPAGSAGRLCLGGAIGRYGDQIQSSGADGEITTSVDPGNLPQPSGMTAAAAGETWYFQLWHRDVSGGSVTSNFSNGCAVDFRF
ncbi:MAG: hypothetical protein AAGG01_20985, partial [Planctomycetota bacterium]